MSSARRFTPVPVVGRSDDQDLATLRSEIDVWTKSDALAELVREFGGDESVVLAEDLATRLENLDRFSEVWDFRRQATQAGRPAERNQAVIVDFEDTRKDLVAAAVDALGLVQPNGPRRDNYDHVLVNGALVRYSIWRSAYAGHLVRTGLRAGSVASLTAYRAMAHNERNPEVDEPTLLARYGLPQVANEAQMMEFLLQREFGLGPLEDHTAGTAGDHGAHFAVRTTADSTRSYALVVAPDPTSAARARTGDTMRFWANNVVDLQPGDTVLSISSAIYGPFQHAAALEHLTVPFGAYVDTVSIDFSVIPPEPAPYEFTPSQYLQEVRSTIRAYSELLRAMDAQR